MNAYPVSRRQGMGTLVSGVAAIAAGFTVQAINVSSFAHQAPPQLATGAGFGRATALSAIAGLLILVGIVLTIVGIIRYAQSGDRASAVLPAAAVPRPPATRPERTAVAFCSSCGAGIVGEGRFCASCGTSTAS